MQEHYNYYCSVIIEEAKAIFSNSDKIVPIFSNPNPFSDCRTVHICFCFRNYIILQPISYCFELDKNYQN